MSGPEDVLVELRGLSAEGFIGVSDAEREVLRTIVLDISFTVAASTATGTDELDGTVDYGAVGVLAAGIVRDRTCKTLEHLAALIADAIESDFDVAGLEVRVAKPDPPTSERIDHVAVTLRR